ncbi:MAG TPA: NADP-dependent isocitrate dehydrogenase, partial [Solirubrobacteraceae bacterium]|nr:NADP-dependent isocitrate dehydrogenase [Solirubrobacteraceae bacterium]
RRVGELDNRGSHFHLARHWARALAEQSQAAELADALRPLAERLEAEQEAILAELTDIQGTPVELGGYYLVDREKATAVMRPSATFNAALESL